MKTDGDAPRTQSLTAFQGRLTALRRRPESANEFGVPRTGGPAQRSVFRALEQLIMLAICFFSIVPLYAMVVIALKPTMEFDAHPASLLPSRHLTFSKFAQAWTNLSLGTAVKNSLILSISAAVLTTAISVLAGYALARIDFQGRRTILVAVIVLLAAPAMAIIVPLFLLMSSWNLLNSYPSAILAEVALGVPFGVYLTYTFMRDIPSELFHAAAVDGASQFQQLRHLAIPLARPALITVALLTGIFAWNDLLIPLVLWQNPRLQVLMVALAGVRPGRTGASDIPLVMAAVSISVLPVIVLFLATRRFFVRGLTEGALK